MGQQYSQYENDYISSSQQINFFNFQSKKQYFSEWQSNLQDEKLICNVTIPGTHNSTSIYGGYLKITPLQCQSLSIDQQLQCGIRFFDLRGRIKNNEFKCYHEWIDQKKLIKDVFEEIYLFLDQNPSEFIIMNLQYELYDKVNHDKEITHEFLKLYTSKEKYWVIQKQIPTVKQMRGKIFLMPNFRFSEKWNQNDYFHFRQCKKQNDWNSPAKKKIPSIKNFCQKSNQEINDQNTNMYINFLSTNTVKQWPFSLAKEINKIYLEDDQCNGKGIIVIDFPGISLINKIISSNQFKN